MISFPFKSLAIASALSTSLLANATLAAPIPDKGLTIEEVTKWLQSEGYRAEIVTDDGDAYIKSATQGVNFILLLEDCTPSKTCKSVDFSSGFDLKDGITLDRANEWNSTKRWGSAYLDKENDPYLEMNVSLAPGSSFEALEDSLDTWNMMIVEFKTFIGW